MVGKIDRDREVLAPDLKRLALQLAIQLPMERKEALRVLAFTRKVVGLISEEDVFPAKNNGRAVHLSLVDGTSKNITASNE